MNINSFINQKKFIKSLKNFNKKKPFPYVVLDNFLKKDVAIKVKKNFKNLEEKKLWSYNNFCEVKKATDNWNFFSAETYQLLLNLNSEKFLSSIKKTLKMKSLYPDFGLNGGGLHLMKDKGILNPHLDYVIHPKLNLVRKFNLIIFFSTNWKKSNGGELCLYEDNNQDKKIPGKQIVKILPKFNRAVFFDTSLRSWHGVNKVKNNVRKSMAVYYLVDKTKKAEKRYKALYSPLKNQSKDKKVLKFIKLRSNIKTSSKVSKLK
tara:strand:+ start:1094 stop:1879 length:786 start_codon:yes stop_codon:yes gene_type:complete